MRPLSEAQRRFVANLRLGALRRRVEEREEAMRLATMATTAARRRPNRPRMRPEPRGGRRTERCQAGTPYGYREHDFS